MHAPTSVTHTHTLLNTHRMLGAPGPLAAMNLVLLPRCVTCPTGCSHQESHPWLCHT
jgi:hypothetical protein